MNAHCRDFRLLLERRLTGRPAPERLAELSWHEHLFTCAECRALLDAEEALESLLASLPEPRLAPEVRERVLARLSISRQEEGLDRLLDVVEAEAPPAHLARNVLAGLAVRGATGARADELDRLLDLDVVEVPPALSARTLSSLRLARRGEDRPRTIRRVVAVLAVAAVLAAVVWIALPKSAGDAVERVEYVHEPAPAPDAADGGRRTTQGVQPADVRVASNAPVPEEVLAALDVLENWDVLVADDSETLLAPLPTTDEALLDELEGEG